MKPGVKLAQAQAELDGIGKRLDRERFQNRGFGWQLVGVQEDLTRRSKPALVMLLGAAGMVLLIVCANVGSLFLVRASGRDREFAVRAALGAGRRRIVSQLLAESLVLAGMGVVLGYGFAYAAVRMLVSLPGIGLPRLYDITVDSRILLFTILTGLVAGIAFGLGPALACSRTRLGESLKQGARGSGGLHGLRLRAAFVAGEIALALVLLLGSTLLMRTFAALRGVDPGFNPSGVLTARLQMPGARYPRAEGAPEFIQRVLQRVQSLPGVQVAGATNAAPLSRGANQNGTKPEGNAQNLEPLADIMQVTPGYFGALGVRLLGGRDFSWQDGAQTEPVLIVDDVYARTVWPNQDPVGKYVNYRGRRRVIGQVKQPRLYEVQLDDRPQVFLPYSQSPNLGVSLVIRANDPARLAAAVRQAVWSEDRSQPVASVRLMEELVDASLADRRLSMLLLSVFAGAALVLATIGIYGVMAYTVGQRTQEIGIRLALGAEQSTIRGMVVRQAMWLAAIGVSVGLAGAMILTRFLESQLYGVAARDPLMFAGAAAVLAAVALVSSYLPALRASCIHPAVALRGE
jgi:putative ABC transport system permease protein